ncbi:hypothetical protein LguiA_013972 [Lonicera macranthoides]
MTRSHLSTILSVLGSVLDRPQPQDIYPHGFVSGSSRPASQGVTHPGISLVQVRLTSEFSWDPKPGILFLILSSQLSCHDASLAIKSVFEQFQSVVITLGTLSPIYLHPHLLNFNPVVSRSFTMSLTRDCICPMVLTRGSGQLPVSTKFDLRSDHGVERNYGRLLPELLSVVPDGIDKMQHKLVFIEIQDVVETMPDNYRRACACGRGAVFFSVTGGSSRRAPSGPRKVSRSGESNLRPCAYPHSPKFALIAVATPWVTLD